MISLYIHIISCAATQEVPVSVRPPACLSQILYCATYTTRVVIFLIELGFCKHQTTQGQAYNIWSCDILCFIHIILMVFQAAGLHPASSSPVVHSNKPVCLNSDLQARVFVLSGKSGFHSHWSNGHCPL